MGFFHDPTQDPKQWVFGQTSKIADAPLQPDRNWLPFAATELQNAEGYDPLDCASINTERAFQILAKRKYNEDIHLSERWIAWATGTEARGGNDPHYVAEFLRQNGAPMESEWPSNVPRSEFYAKPPAHLWNSAKRFLEQWDFKHDTVRGLDAMWEALQYSPLGVSVHWNAIDDRGYYYKASEGPDTHWSVVCLGGEYGKYWVFLDSAEPVLKKARWDMNPQLVKRYSLTKKSTVEELTLYVRILTLIRDWWLTRNSPAMPSKIAQDERNAPTATSTPSQPIHAPQSRYKWGTVNEARHSVRLICDEEKLSLADKNLICAVIQAESGFKNTARCFNKNKKGEVTSIDYGICQINSYWHIGNGKTFPSVEYVVDNPDKAVRFMIAMHKIGRLSLWVAFKNGSYRKYL